MTPEQELKALKEGIYNQGYAIMVESNGRHSIYDTSEKTQSELRHENDMIADNIVMQLALEDIKTFGKENPGCGYSCYKKASEALDRIIIK